MVATHQGFIIKCSCGRVIAQCRCICKDKRVEVRPHPACGMAPLQAEPTTHPTSQKQPHRCPVCSGNGTVDAGFYTRPGTQQTWSAGGMTPEECRSCKGTGIVWEAEA